VVEAEQVAVVGVVVEVEVILKAMLIIVNLKSRQVFVVVIMVVLHRFDHQLMS
jgi:hypothetical protein